VKSSSMKKFSFYCIYPFLADAATVSVIASGSQHRTMRAISHRIARSLSVSAPTFPRWTDVPMLEAASGVRRPTIFEEICRRHRELAMGVRRGGATSADAMSSVSALGTDCLARRSPDELSALADQHVGLWPYSEHADLLDRETALSIRFQMLQFMSRKNCTRIQCGS
jgi:hypothetical protein